jgi:3-dehydroquinate synthase
MQSIRLILNKPLDRSYDVIIGRGSLGQLHREIGKLGRFSTYAMITDEQVRPLVTETLAGQLRSHGVEVVVLTLPAGEAAKTVDTVVDLCKQFLGFGLDRESLLLAVGGGVVGDISGFTAAIYLRGVSYIQVPTTLLAQVDSAIGGKTGVDLGAGKNLLGAFHQPLLVLADPDVLATLPPDAMREGLAEVIKTALIGDPELFATLEHEGSRLVDFRNPLLEEVIVRTCGVKCRVVNQDEREGGLRRILNFGHTLGHAVEAASNYRVSHGQAVAAGMGTAVRFSERLAGLGQAEARRALALIEAVGLRSRIPLGLNSQALLAALAKDKKVEAGVCHFVLLSGIGQPVVRPIPLGQLRRELESMLA